MRQTKAHLTAEVTKWKRYTIGLAVLSVLFAVTAGYGQHQYDQLETSTEKLIHIIQTEPEAFCPSSSGGFEIIPSEPQEATPAPPSSGSAPSLACPDGNCLTTPHSF